MSIYVVERASGAAVEIEADGADQDPASSRVTFFQEAEGKKKQVGSFINVNAWYIKPAEAEA